MQFTGYQMDTQGIHVCNSSLEKKYLIQSPDILRRPLKCPTLL